MPVVPAVAHDRYYLNHEIGDYLRIAEEAAPHLLRLYTIGSSLEGRPLLMAEITNRASGEGHEKPAIWVDGGWRGGQLLGSSACLELVRQLVSHYGRDPLISDLLDHVTFYICPRLAADAAEVSLLSGEWCWSSTRPHSHSRLGMHPGDVNGDGRCLQMRQVDELGEWKLSRRDPRLLVPRTPDDRQGPFYRLLPEGMVEGSLVRYEVPDPRGQLDLELNFPTGEWNSQRQGPFPFSEPETRVVADFFRSHTNLGAVVTFGNLSGCLGFPRPQEADRGMLRRLGQRFQEWSGLTVSHEGSTGYQQWAYQQLGLLVLRCEPWNLARAAGIERWDSVEAWEEAELALLLRWLDRECPGAFQPWTAFDHPQLGLVEIGGWDWLYSWLNPPPGPLLVAELERFAKVALASAQALPRLNVLEFVEETIGWSEFQPPDPQHGDFLPLRKLRAVVENRGYLPTWVCSGVQGPDPGLGLQLQLLMDGGQQLLLGREHQLAGQLLGVGLAGPDAAIPHRWSGAQQRFEAEWLVQGSGRIQLEVRHPRAGVRLANVTTESMVHPPVPVPAPPAYAPPAPAAAPLPPPPPPPVPSRSAPVRGEPLSAPPPLPAAPSRPAAAAPPARPAAPARPVARPTAPPAQSPPAPAARPAARPAGGASPAQPARPAPPGRPAQPARPAAPAPPAQPLAAAPPTAPLPAPPQGLAEVLAAPPAPPSSESRGRVLGSPPPKPGASVSSYAARATELIQASQNQPRPAGGGGGEDDFQPFSPGLPIKSAFAGPPPGRPVESPPALDYDTLPEPPEAPPAESRLPTLFLRNRERPK